MRVAGAFAVFAVATVILLLVGVEMEPYLEGVLIGMVVVGLAVGAVLLVQERRR